MMSSKNVGNTQEFNIQSTSSKMTFANCWDHFLKRLGINRGGNRVVPGLYALGKPALDSPVFVTANYSRSFDALRKALRDTDCYILVLDTFGINVWCAAGKGTFGTDELVHRTEETKLAEIVRHRKLILPQLSAPGVAAHEVKKRTGFSVEYGPVRAADLLEYVKTRNATVEMRRVRFTFRDRLELVPVELIQTLIIMAIVGCALFFIGGPMAATAAIAAVLAGVVLFPILLPWIPTPNFSTKGFILGGIIALPFFLAKLTGNHEVALWQRTGLACVYLLTLSPVTAFLALNFTGATTFTSRTGVKREIFTYVPIMAWMFGGGVILSITFTLIVVLGG
ncbi:carbon monoxide dehydrogenase [candidate division KSB1 bacterium]|nr:carbon monoxide dehydrogenase [candidate division KSB1 bacterium]NIR69755.1 carbon monoxide dehydrogenase [candidate division KSB1 bacterium]NIS22938.1 carbon monoxide dehydrogenase [candidate division KSB1 bacterium]NIT69795.1 carbon monoxide dehydrogenase [candidate division KSB1 bacterium]NIU23469.1 carbon monoxide dehydrogenase [candidate division KSB1 bacterium]